MSANPNANGGLLLRDLVLPSFRDYAVPVEKPGHDAFAEATRVLGEFLRDVMKANPTRFRVFGADEVASNLFEAVLKATDRQWDAQRLESDDHLAPDGRVMEMLSEHQCQGWLEGYLLTGRHGLVHLLRSLHPHRRFDVQPTRQMAEFRELLNWRRPIASLNYLLSSHVWRQDHNGFSHQDPGFIDHAMKKLPMIRVYLPPDANCLLSVADHCLRSRQYINVIVAGKEPALNGLSTDDAILHCTRGIGIWEWSANDDATRTSSWRRGDVPTLETLLRWTLAQRAPVTQTPGGQRRRLDATATSERASPWV